MLTNQHTILWFKINLLFIGLFCLIISNTQAQVGGKPLHPSPVIAWTVSDLCYGDTAYFTNNTTGETINAWVIFEDTGSGETPIYTSPDKHIKFKFPHVGLYRVQLDADNGHLVTLSRYLTISNTIKANFDYQDCNSQFTNLSCCFTSCFWDFGDGHTSTQSSPTHFFENTGTYTVKLKVFNGNQADSTFNDITITTLNDFVGTFTYKIEGDTVFFKATDSINNVFVNYHWAFGDGTTTELTGFDKGMNVKHHYEVADSAYYVFLLIKRFCSHAYSSQFLDMRKPKTLAVGELSVYPNPSNKVIHIASDRKNEMTNIKVINYLSQELTNLQMASTTNGYDIDLSVYPDGLYILKVYFGEEVITKRIIKHQD
jgi:PKD repeat protein